MLSAGSIAGVAANGTLNSVNNGTFEAPALTAGTYQYGPSGSSWSFSGTAGVASNSSAFTSSNGSAPGGSQVAFVQGKGIMTQSLYLDAGAYTITFQAAQRGSYQSSYQQLYVTVDGNRVAYVTPTSTSYASYQTQSFRIATAGTHTILIKGLNPQGGDNTALVDNVAIQSQANAIGDGTFEAPGLVAGSYRYAPDGSPWKYTGGAGVSSNNSSFTWANSVAPEGTQVAFLQGTGAMSQSVYLDAGSYAVSFYSVQRAFGTSRTQQIAVQVDGVQVGLVTPSTSQYASFETSSFSVATSGMHVVQLVGLNPKGGDNTALVDNVAIAKANPISNSSFEVPGLLSKTHQYGVSGSLWSFSGTAGIAKNGSQFTSSNANAPSGTHVAFLQNNGSMTQSVYLDAGVYCIAFKAAQRGSYQSSSQQIYVTVDGNRVGYATPSGTSYSAFQTLNFSVATAGMHSVVFKGINPQGGDNTALVDDVTISAQTNTINDGGFEVPALTSGTYKYAPDGLPWQFDGTAGVSANGSDFTLSNANAPYGTQVAFLQGAGGMSQTVYLDAGSYAVSFQAAQRVLGQASYQQVGVLVDGVQVGAITPSGAVYSAYQVSSFPIAVAGAHTIRFVGLNPQGGDNTVFLDNISIAKASPVSNGGFEAPALAASAYQYQPTGTLWQFSGSSGVTSNNSTFTAANPSAPSGSQAAFLEGTGNISQSVYLAAGNYCVSLQAAQRAGQTGSQQIAVMLDDVQIGLISPASTSYAVYQTPSLLVATAGMHTIRLLGMDPQNANSTALIDNLQIVSA